MLAIEELCDKVDEVRRVSDRVMSLVIVYHEEVVKVECAYAAQGGKPMEEEQFFKDQSREWATHDQSREWTTHNTTELII